MQLTGSKLIRALQTTTSGVLVQNGRNIQARGIAPIEAIALIGRTEKLRTWVGFGARDKKTRAVVIEKIAYEFIDLRPSLPWRECFRTTGGASVLSPSPEWLRHMNSSAGVAA